MRFGYRKSRVQVVLVEVAVTTALLAVTFLVTLKDPGKPSAAADRGT